MGPQFNTACGNSIILCFRKLFTAVKLSDTLCFYNINKLLLAMQ